MDMNPQEAAARWGLGNKAFNTAVYGVSPEGHLVITLGDEAYDVTALAKEHGTPLEIFMPEVMAARIRTMQDSFTEEMRRNEYPAHFSYFYPMKVNQRREFVETALAEGAQIETSSGNELSIVRDFIRKGGAPISLRINCNGPKSREYLDLIRSMHDEGFAITPIIESLEEMAALQEHPGPVGVRVDLAIKVAAHWDKKHNRFGIPEKELRELPPIPNLVLLSYHVSSQIGATDSFAKVLTHAMELYAHLKARNPGLETINIGGGASIPYQKRPFYTTEELVAAIVTAAKESAERLGVGAPNLICEWGQHVVAPSQLTVFKIISQKSITDVEAQKWYVIDGSFIANLPDTWSIHQDWHVAPANQMRAPAECSVWFAGSSCDSDDEYVTRERLLMPSLPEKEPLYVAFFDTGAYQDSLSSYHCLLSHPARIMLTSEGVRPLSEKQAPAQVGALFGW
jgi:arginine decarboxylase